MSKRKTPKPTFAHLVTVRACCPKCGGGKLKAYGKNPNREPVAQRGTVSGTGQTFQAYQRLRKRCDDCGQIVILTDYLLAGATAAEKAEFARRLEEKPANA